MLIRHRFRFVVALALLAGAVCLVPALRADDKADVAVIEMTGGDTMQYNITEFKVKAGQTVKLTLKNIGQLPAVAMSHNCVILKAGTDFNKFATAANQAPPTYLPKDQMDSIIAHTKMLGPGESDTIEFTAPAVGSYDYLCTFPGHYALMKGKMIVE